MEWATTEYLYDITQEYYQVVQETQKSKSKTSTTTAYAYGLERFATYGVDANNTPSKTSYIYDGRGSVAQSISLPVPGENANSVLAIASAQFDVQSFSYTAFGEQMGAKKVTGWGYNAEAFDATTGMINLRMRQYESILNRFGQKDIVRGSFHTTLSINRYLFVHNSVTIFSDPTGLEPVGSNEPNISQIMRIAQEVITYANDISATEAAKLANLSDAYEQIKSIVQSGSDVPADLVRMMQEAERALKNAGGGRNLRLITRDIKCILMHANSR